MSDEEEEASLTNHHQHEEQEEEAKIASIRDLCQVPNSRARELLDAASGNVERAIGIHFNDSSSVARSSSTSSNHQNNTSSSRSTKAVTATTVRSSNYDTRQQQKQQSNDQHQHHDDEQMLLMQRLREVQEVCGIDESRARQLLQNNADSVEQAINEHFSFSSAVKTAPAKTEMTAANAGGASSSRNNNNNSSQSRSIHAKESNKPANRQKPPIASPSSKKSTTKNPTTLPASGQKRSRQSTMDAFLGLPTPKEKGPKQRKIDLFFKAAAGGEAVDVDVKDAVEASCEEAGHEEKGTETGQASLPTRIKQEEDLTVVKIEMEEDENSTITTGHATPIKARSVAPELGSGPRMEQAASTTKSNPSTCNGENSSESHQEQLGNSVGLPYSLLSDRFQDMVSTTKRNAKLESLRDIFNHVIQHLGGIHMNSTRDDDAYILTSTIDLMLGKLSVTSKHNVVKESLTLQVSGAAVSSAVQSVTGASRSMMREEYRRTGDLGDVASTFYVSSSVKSFFKSSSHTNTDSGLSIVEVHDLMQKIATVPPGKGSQSTRQNLLVRLLRGCKERNEIRFLVRTLIGNMRLGATLKSVIAALAASVDGMMGESSNGGAHDAAQILQDTFNVCPRILDISKALLEGGVHRAATECTLVVGHPIQPMLANPAHSLEQVKTFMSDNPAVAEWKYDGVRCQAHFDGKIIKLFSRHLHENTAQYPDAVQYLLEAKNNDVTSFICDAEIVGVIPSEGAGDGYKLLPFQDLSSRRGMKAADPENSISIRIYSYDLMYLNGKSLLREPLWRRQELLQEHFAVTPGFCFASSIPLPRYDETVLQNGLKEAVEGGAEGLMIKLTGCHAMETSLSGLSLPDTGNKTLGSDSGRSYGYESGTRSRLWLKLKRDYVKGSADTIDVVPIGAWFGNGRKAQAGFLSPVLLAVYDPDDDVFRSISRCMSFADDMYKATRDFYFEGTPYPSHVGMGEAEVSQTEGLKPEDASDSSEEETQFDDAMDTERVNCYPKRPSTSTYITNENPSIWFKPLEVWEVSFADLTLSRVHTAAAGLVNDEQGRGVALRFPRFVRRRTDKSVTMATTTVQIAELFQNQAKITNKIVV